MLDEHYKKHGTTLGPLHGLPVSLKDQFHVKGNDTSMAYIGWLGTFEGSKDPHLVHKVDSQVVTELQSLGAVLYCKVNSFVRENHILSESDIVQLDQLASDPTRKLISIS